MSQNHTDKTQIEQVIEKYIDALNQSKTEMVLPLFTLDAVLMGVDAPTVEGAEQLRAFFDHGFGMIKLEPKIDIDEIVVSEDYAFARSHSQVRFTVLQTNESHSEENRELFVFRKDGGDWKIARYMFNKVPTSR
ncbi:MULTISPECIES: SgcJ/EcaC family oxidoreductase [unclassified Rhizobium]|uniref:YybH family protein n=1 Tax=unclassified Rhizobium TaxID=2613769 RepID=UPI000EA84978|nr:MULTISPECIES: SgcJ/EcaC family oxidoreductase [unclassified Rhizobium]AYG69191.1 SgcJ/EcaC family oxidoreductase [Rhizobium sp. CCGE531]AYG75571.1 SgcJ/EcaC family oxidoreductase [Rhizobium sp. CCGE532]